MLIVGEQKENTYMAKDGSEGISQSKKFKADPKEKKINIFPSSHPCLK